MNYFFKLSAVIYNCYYCIQYPFFGAFYLICVSHHKNKIVNMVVITIPHDVQDINL